MQWLVLFILLNTIWQSVRGGAFELEGRVVGYQTTILSLPVSGKVHQVMVQPGQRVTPKTLLLTLDPRPFTLKITQARAEWAHWQSVQAEAQREYERTQSLYQQNLLADHERQLKQQAYQQAVAQVQRAQAEFAQAELNLEYSQLYPPFEGLIWQRFVDPGQTVINHCQATPLVVLANPRQMLVEAWTKPDQPFTIGQALEVAVEQQRYPGQFYALAEAPASMASTALYRLHVVFSPDIKQQIAIGQAVKLYFLSTATALSLSP